MGKRLFASDSMMKRIGIAMRPWALALMLVAGAGAQSLAADSVADFYRGKTIELDVGTGVGGGYDANARLVARHLGRFLPGHPAIVVNNVPGGGGIRAANALYNRSARDGSVIGTFSNAMITEPLLGSGPLLFEPRVSPGSAAPARDGFPRHAVLRHYLLERSPPKE
jgi:hypothetical protein